MRKNLEGVAVVFADVVQGATTLPYVLFGLAAGVSPTRSIAG